MARVAAGKGVSGEWPGPRDCRKVRKKPVFCVAARHRLLRITYCGQFPNQTEKLSGTDTSRNSHVFSPLGYGSLAVLANNPEENVSGRLWVTECRVANHRTVGYFTCPDCYESKIPSPQLLSANITGCLGNCRLGKLKLKIRQSGIYSRPSIQHSVRSRSIFSLIFPLWHQSCSSLRKDQRLYRQGP